MFSCNFYNAFQGILKRHLRRTTSLFCVFFSNFGIKKLSALFSSISETVAANWVTKLFLRFHQSHHQSEAFGRILKDLFNKQPPTIFNIFKNIIWKESLYTDYLSSCDYGFTKDIIIFDFTNKLIKLLEKWSRKLNKQEYLKSTRWLMANKNGELTQS